jgi:ribosomal protein S18 acetylase RimI-like enzyme
VEIREFAPTDEDALVSLWERCELLRPWNDPHRDIARKLADSPWGLLVAIIDDAIIGSVMVGYDGHRGWINYLATDEALRRQGVARALMDEAVHRLRERGCPKVNLQVRSGNVNAVRFYELIGFARDDADSYGFRLEDDLAN